MLQLKKIAVTGGIASGKTTVCKLFQTYGAYVINADQIAHQLLSQNNLQSHKVIKLFGETILTDGAIDRKKLANVVFEDKKKLQQLQALIHPFVRQEIQKEWQEACKKNVPLFVAEVPLLFEARFDTDFDATILVVCDEETCSARFCKKHNSTKQDYERRARFLMPVEEKCQKATYIIDNSKTFRELEEQVKHLFTKLIY